jgi:uncharacterized protein
VTSPDQPERDPLLDPPAGAPGWLPSVDRERSLRWLRLGVLAVLVLGVAAFVVRGANEPADPELGPPAGPAPGTEAPAPLEVPGPTDAGDEGAADGGVLAPTPEGDLPGDPDRVPLDGFGEVAIEVTTADGEVRSWCLLAALEAAQRQQGLMEVTDLQGYPGMVFVFDQDTSSAFWMRNTRIPLTIAWIAADGAYVGSTDMVPCPDDVASADCPRYPPDGPFRIAIEVPQGELGELGVGPGAMVQVGGDCAPRRAT